MDQKPNPHLLAITKKTAKLLTLEDLELIPPATNLSPADRIFTTPPDDVTRRAFEAYFSESKRREASTLFDIRTASEWIEKAATMPTPHMLFDTMWYEGDLCILFADTNVGKSILAVQIGDSISRGQAIPGFGMDAAAQPVAYFDFELSAKQFQARYSYEYGAHYPFADTFYRAELDITDSYIERGYTSFETYLTDQLEGYIEQTGIKVIIIDNITYLRSENEKAKDAYSLMNLLNTLKKKHALSMLVLAHTPKRDQSRPIETNHLQGSKQLANLCDSIIAIGKSAKDPDLRYIKQIKQRLGAKNYEEDNVCLCQVTKPHDFLHFEFIQYSTEREHLREVGDKEMGQRIATVKDLSASGMTQREIATQLGLSVSTVNKYLNR